MLKFIKKFIFAIEILFKKLYDNTQINKPVDLQICCNKFKLIIKKLIDLKLLMIAHYLLKHLQGVSL